MARNDATGPLPPKFFYLSLSLVTAGCLLVLLTILHEPTGVQKREDGVLLTECEKSHSGDGNQIVFMLIDAWKYDFLAAEDSPMRFVKKMVKEGRAVMMRQQVHVPTVTEPRIKAMTAGRNPSFASLINNFFSSDMRDDNWLKIADKAEKRVLFYGDDTWLRLFPNLFTESVGVPSFNVPDYTEVDNIVTDNMRRQIGRAEWDVLILHYLGLDHIGHSLGGQSAQIPVKLQEMDAILEEMFMREPVSKNLTIVVAGDHGMTLQGGHGGSSASETATPVVVMKTNAEQVGARADETVPIQQVDVVSLMSHLLGQPLPVNSLGVSVLPELKKIWKIEPQASISDFLSHLRQWTAIFPDNEMAWLLEAARNLSCEGIRSKYIAHRTIPDFFETIEAEQEKILSQPQQIGGFKYFLGILIIITASFLCLLTVPFKGLKPNTVLLLLPVVACLASSLVEEEHEIWYYIASGSVLFHLWSTLHHTKFELSQIVCVSMILLLHRCAQSASTGTRRRWLIDPELLPGILPADHSLFEPLSFLGNWLHSTVLFPKYPSVMTVVWLGLFALNSWKFGGKLNWLVLLLQAVNGFFWLFSRENLQQLNSSWIPLIVAVFDFKSAAFLYFSTIVQPTFVPVLLSTYHNGRLARRIGLDTVAVISLLGSCLFYTGLSNSVSSIDIRAGYAGIQEYSPVLVGAQILANMYAPAIFFLLGYGSVPGLQTLRMAILVASTVSLCIFSEHLFVWTVFTPKVLFDSMHLHTVVMCQLITLLISKLLKTG